MVLSCIVSKIKRDIGRKAFSYPLLRNNLAASICALFFTSDSRSVI